MISYILEVSFCSLCFYLIYILLLSKETFFQLNRYYLLSTLVLSFLLPLISYLPPVLLGEENIYMAVNYLHPITITADVIEVTIGATSENSIINFSVILMWIYSLGFIFYSLKLWSGLFQIYGLYKNGEQVKQDNYIFVKTKQVHLPFSFLNVMYWSEKMPLVGEDATKIKMHEEAHIQQNHSLDILLLELLGIVFWCNPLIFFYKRSLKVVHEYLADKAVLQTVQTKDYGQLLIKQTRTPLHFSITNNFIHSQLKKRILMMTRQKSHKKSLAKYLLLIPTLVLLMLVFTNKDSIAQITDAPEGLTIEDQDVYVVVEKMPQFPGCETIENVNEQSKCAEKKLFDFLYSNIQYPKIAKEKRIEGKVIIQFVIAKDGRVANAKILRDIGDGCGQEALRVVRSMPNWTVGQQRGKPVAVSINLPVVFDGGFMDDDDTEKKQDKDVFTIVDEMPRFPGCESNTDKQERKKCAQKAMLNFIYKNISYPKEAREKGVEGTVVIRFVVNEDGTINDLDIIRNVGGGCGEEALRVLTQMNEMPEKWIPGKHKGKAVKVFYNMPIKFRLAGKSKSEGGKKPENLNKKHYLEKFNVTPNPTTGEFVVNVRGETGVLVLTVTNAMGNKFFQKEFKEFNGEFTESINMNKAPKGTYFINIKQNNKQYTEQIQIQ